MSDKVIFDEEEYEASLGTVERENYRLRKDLRDSESATDQLRHLCVALTESCAGYRELTTGYKARIEELTSRASALERLVDIHKDIEQMLRKRLEKYEDGLDTPHQD